MWDKILPNLVGNTPAALAGQLTVPDCHTQFATAVDYHHWPEIWAGETMQEFTAAYEGFKYKSAAYVPDPRHAGQTMLKISIDLPEGTAAYKANQTPRAEAQLQKAAARLAQLLSVIHYR